ncbi:D-inositol-3-phosphate glycosyltransferase [subsurface metagenome]
MNILYIIPGSGDNFYCGNCLRDSEYVSAIRDRGHQVIKIPMYLPLFSDENDRKDTPLFYNAISIYLKQLYPILRKAPPWFDRLIGSKPLLKLAAKMAGSTRARGLGELTVSMLMGERGVQKRELDQMVDWIDEHYMPDVIHLSNALLLGVAGRIRERIRVPIVCTLQDEDVWVDVMKSEFRDRAWELMREDSKNVDLFITVSNYYGDLMKKKLAIPDDKIDRIHLGVCLDDYTSPGGQSATRSIGFISRMNHENGFDILVDAFILLKQRNGFDDVKLVLTGGSTGDDTRFIKQNRRRLWKAGFMEDVDFHEDFVDGGRLEFFNKISVLSVPVRLGEAFGLYLVEAMAAGVPAVQPSLGAFPEIVGLSDGGLIYSPNNPAELAESLAKILDDKEMLLEKSLNARRGVEDHFNIKAQAGELIAHYERLNDTAEYVN